MKRALLPALLLWAAATLAFAAGGTALRRADAEAQLQEEGRRLQRLLAQRADQHDAHLTAISALAAGLPVTREPLAQLADGILRFYPRVLAADVAAVTAEGTPSLIFTTTDAPERRPMQSTPSAPPLTIASSSSLSTVSGEPGA